jgi:hypothetical protein
MSKRALFIVTAGLFSFVALAVIPQARQATPNQPTVISGDDFGFRVDRYDGRRPVGVIVVRVDGRWVEPKSVPQSTPLGSR